MGREGAQAMLPNDTRRRPFVFIGQLLLTFGLFWVVGRYMNEHSFYGHFSKLSMPWVLLGALLYMANLVFKGLRFWHVLSSLGAHALRRRDGFQLSTVGVFAGQFLPLRGGEVLTAFFASRLGKISIARSVGVLLLIKASDATLVIFFSTLGILMGGLEVAIGLKYFLCLVVIGCVLSLVLSFLSMSWHLLAKPLEL